MREIRFAWCALLAACVTSIDPLSRDTGVVIGESVVRLAVSVSDDEILPGQPDTLRVTLTNEGASPVTLHFGSGCQILPYIADSKGRIVLPDGGGWGCFLALTQLTLDPNVSVVREHVWTGSTAFASEMPLRPLAPGDYWLWAEVPASEGHLKTAPIRVTLH